MSNKLLSFLILSRIPWGNRDRESSHSSWLPSQKIGHHKKPAENGGGGREDLKNIYIHKKHEMWFPIVHMKLKRAFLPAAFIFHNVECMTSRYLSYWSNLFPVSKSMNIIMPHTYRFSVVQYNCCCFSPLWENAAEGSHQVTEWIELVV